MVPHNCLRSGAFGIEKSAGGYLAVTQQGELPAKGSHDHYVVRHGYAARVSGTWYFFTDLEPAIAFGRAARMSLDCSAYGVFWAAHETRHCEHHGDERALIVTGPGLDRCDGEAELIARFAAGVAEHPESSHWHAPKGSGR